jgi:hypothetical protein
MVRPFNRLARNWRQHQDIASGPSMSLVYLGAHNVLRDLKLNGAVRSNDRSKHGYLSRPENGGPVSSNNLMAASKKGP